MTTRPTTHKDRFPCAARYGTYVGRVGALAVALGIGAAVATGHGLGLGVAYAGEGDSTSGETADNGDGGGDDGDGAPTAPPAPAAAPGDSKPSRSPLARISDVPKMIFNATGGAKTAGATSGMLEIQAGDKLQWECHIINDSNVTLDYSNHVQTGEMCNLWGVTVGPVINQLAIFESPFTVTP